MCKNIVCEVGINHFFIANKLSVSVFLNYGFKWYDTLQNQSNTEIYSSFGSIYFNPVITVMWLRLAWVEWGCEKRLCLSSMNIN